jgi:hypothetical protein
MVDLAEDTTLAVRAATPRPDPEGPSTHPQRLDARLRSAARLASPAIALYVGLRILSLDALAILTLIGRGKEPGRSVYWDGSTDSWRGYRSLGDILLSWDGRWYSKIATYGYENLATGGIDEYGIPYLHRLAFFPLYPYLARSLGWVPGLTPSGACLVVSFLSSIAAAWGIFAIGNLLRGRRFGIVLAGLWALVPAGVSQNGAFTESLYTALCAWALYAVLRRRWVVAGLITAVTGLTRPTAIALVATIGFAALVAAVRGRDGWRPYAAMALCPVGYVGWVLVAGYYLGSPGGFFDLQRNHWDSYFDFGKTTGESVVRVLFNQEHYKESIFLVTLVAVLGVAVCTILAAAQRMPWVLVLFATVMFVGSVGSHAHFTSLARHLLPVFPALLVPAVVAARARTRTLAVLLPTAAVLSGWYGGWLVFTSGQVI